MRDERAVRERIEELQTELLKLRYSEHTLSSDIDIARLASALAELKWVIDGEPVFDQTIEI